MGSQPLVRLENVKLDRYDGEGSLRGHLEIRPNHQPPFGQPGWTNLALIGEQGSALGLNLRREAAAQLVMALTLVDGHSIEGEKGRYLTVMTTDDDVELMIEVPAGETMGARLDNTQRAAVLQALGQALAATYVSPG